MSHQNRSITKRTESRKAKLAELAEKRQAARLSGKFRDPGDLGPCERCKQWPIYEWAPPNQPYCHYCIRTFNIQTMQPNRALGQNGSDAREIRIAALTHSNREYRKMVNALKKRTEMQEEVILGLMEEITRIRLASEKQ